MRNIFGNLMKEYLAPEDGGVIGKSVSSVNQTRGDFTLGNFEINLIF